MTYDIEFNATGLSASRVILKASIVAEEKRFGTVWLPESNGRDPAILLAGIASVTNRIRIGSAVVHIYSRTPVEAGIMSATLDELSNGRFELGLGVANENIASWHGLNGSNPFGRLTDYITILRSVYSGKRVDYQGKFYSSNGFKLEFSSPEKNLRIWIGALGPKMAQFAGRMGDGMIINMANPERIEFLTKNFIMGANETHRETSEMNIAAKVRVSMNADVERARTALKKIVALYSLAPHYKDRLEQMGLEEEVKIIGDAYKVAGFSSAVTKVSSDMLDRLPVIACKDTAELGKKLQDYENSGANHIILTYVPSSDRVFEEVSSFLDQFS